MLFKAGSLLSQIATQENEGGSQRLVVSIQSYFKVYRTPNLNTFLDCKGKNNDER